MEYTWSTTNTRQYRLESPFLGPLKFFSFVAFAFAENRKSNRQQ